MPAPISVPPHWASWWDHTVTVKTMGALFSVPANTANFSYRMDLADILQAPIDERWFIQRVLVSVQPTAGVTAGPPPSLIAPGKTADPPAGFTALLYLGPNWSPSYAIAPIPSADTSGAPPLIADFNQPLLLEAGDVAGVTCVISDPSYNNQPASSSSSGALWYAHTVTCRIQYAREKQQPR